MEKREMKIPSFEGMQRAQKAAMCDRWGEFKEVTAADKIDLLEEFDLFGNTAIHVALRSNDPKLLREMLEMLPEEEMWGALRKGNSKGNTLLHELIFCDNVEMANVIFEFEKKAVPPSPLPEVGEEKMRALVEIPNNKGETPPFRVATRGNLKMMKHLVKYGDGDDMRMHLRRSKDKLTILHASVTGQFFDIAVWIMMRMDVDGTLAVEKNKRGLTCLQLLSRMPHVFRSHETMGALTNLIYNLLPEEGYEIEGDDDTELFRQKRDLENAQQDNAKPFTSGLSRLNYAVWKQLTTVFDGINQCWKKKKQHKLAECLAQLLAKHDDSWKISYNDVERTSLNLQAVPFNVAKRKKQVERKEKKKQQEEDDSERKKPKKQQEEDDSERKKQKQDDDNDGGKHYYHYTPLLIAASTGIVEIVKIILEENPEAIDHVSKDQQNILHMAVKHRQLEIFKLLKKKSALGRLASRISKENGTILHQVARMDYYRGVHLAGAAFQLQDELRWYKRVEKILPSPFLMHGDQDSLTAGDVLDIEHDDMLRDAQDWIKKTAESCSTVAVLVSTVVFAAAYTIPGGFEAGRAVLLRSTVFIFFTVMDIVALAFSLASVVMFLSILTSPFELWDFHKSLPRKLNVGFSFLFLSLTTTMLAFSATILLTIQLQWKHWTSTLVYSAAFFPVTIFGLIEFPLYMKLPSLLRMLFKKLVKVLPISGVIRYFRTRDAKRKLL